MNGTDVIARQDDDLVTTRIDGELVGMSVEQGACYGFDAVATRLWELIEQPRTLDALCEQLVAEFEVDAATCRGDVLAFLDELRGEGLVSVVSAG
jgi:hypothetical protein